jgi:hypothetical protein
MSHVTNYVGVTNDVPSLSISQTPSLGSHQDITFETKKCPFCAEEVRKEAIKCKHCHSVISDEAMGKSVQNDKILHTPNVKMVKNKGTVSSPTPMGQSTNKGMLPSALQEKIDQIEAEKIDYPIHADDINKMNRFIANGIFDCAISTADNIIKSQKNLRKFRK